MASKISQIGQFIFAPVEQSEKSAVLFIRLSKFFLAQAVQQPSHSGIYYASRPSAELVPRNVQLPAHLSLNSPLRLVRFDHVVSITVNVDNSVM